MALEDAQRTMGLVRFHAAEYHIDPHKIGVLGFSAGGHLVAAISTHFDKRLYPAVDAADKESCRPDFAVALYPGHLWISNKKFELNPNVPVTRQTPPTFLLQAENDPVDNVNNSLVYYIALKNAGVPVEMHLYAEGKHAFGLRPTKFPITRWPELVETWLGTIGLTSYFFGASPANGLTISTPRIVCPSCKSSVYSLFAPDLAAAITTKASQKDSTALFDNSTASRMEE